MNHFLLIATVVVSVTALPYELLQDEQGQEFYLVPKSRFRRDTTNWSLQSPGIASISHTGTLFDNEKHHVDGTAYASKNLHMGGIVPELYGGGVDYSYKPSKSNFGLQAEHVHGGGTDVKASGTYNFIQQKNAEVGLSGQYSRQYGGPGGTGKPDYGVFLKGKIDI